MATLHNAEDVARKDVREGDRVLIEKGGDVIPKVVKPILPHPDGTAREPWQMPTACPECGSAAAPGRRGSRLALREHVVPGAAAPQPRAFRLARRDEHRGARRVAGRSADRAGAGARLRRYLSPRRRRSSRTLVVAPREPQSERAVPRKLGKVGRNVFAQIERSKANDLSRLIYALGIRHVGEKAAATLARHFRTMDALLDAPVEALQSVPEIGPVVAASVRAFADEPRNRELVGSSQAAGVNMDEPGAGAERRARAAGGQDLRADRHAGVDVARGGDRGARSGSAPRCPAR